MHHSWSSAKLWELCAGVMAGDLGQHLDDFALGDAGVKGFGDSASSYALAWFIEMSTLPLASCVGGTRGRHVVVIVG